MQESLDLLEPGDLRLGQVVIKRVAIVSVICHVAYIVTYRPHTAVLQFTIKLRKLNKKIRRHISPICLQKHVRSKTLSTFSNRNRKRNRLTDLQ